MTPNPARKRTRVLRFIRTLSKSADDGYRYFAGVGVTGLGAAEGLAI